MILYVRCVNILSYRVNNKSGGCYKAFELENAARQVTFGGPVPRYNECIEFKRVL